MNFQELIFTLQRYWARQGCAILQPYDMEMGAGTFHTATFLRALGPEPWKAAYVQPSRRPKDGRYGENPNRLQHYYQLQVVLKPSPDDIQELYLGSLRELGIGSIAFLPLAQGVLTRKYLGGIPEGSRASQGKSLNPEVISEATIAKVRALDVIATARGQTLAQMALAWVLRGGGITTALIGASKPEQVADCVGAVANLAFSDAELAEIDRISL